jgi:DNA invertase Pin-like site-specific DNA recombinase
MLAAIVHALQVGATLLIAKLDRLSCNVGFIFALRNFGVDFVCCDMPDANTLTVGIFIVLAQHERELISKPTCEEALAALKARGVRLGVPANLTTQAIRHGQVVRQQNARDNKENRQFAARRRVPHPAG